MFGRFRVLPAFCLSQFLFACHSLSVYVPEQRLLLPENAGKFAQGSFAITYGEHTRIRLVDNIHDAQPQLDKPYLSSRQYLGLLTEFSLIPELDLFYTGHTSGVKWQILGAPRATAEAGNVSLALALSQGYASEELDQSSNVDEVRHAKGYARALWTDATVLAGYRRSTNVLFYGGIGNNAIVTKGSIVQVPDAGPLVWEIEKRRGQSFRLLGGVHYTTGGTFFVQLEPAYISSSYENAEDLERFSLSGSLGWQW